MIEIKLEEGDSRRRILEELNNFIPINAKEGEMRDETIEFVIKNTNCFERDNLQGHVTASAWIVNLDSSMALMTHHKKLNRWLQLGGHCDGDSNVQRVALKEAQEESGLENFKQPYQGIYAIDIHTIPAREDVPEHLHYDIVYKFEADDVVPLTVSDESNNLAWVKIDELERETEDLLLKNIIIREKQ